MKYIPQILCAALGAYMVGHGQDTNNHGILFAGGTFFLLGVAAAMLAYLTPPERIERK